ncbi:MAG: HDIG domain-containing protein [Clostridia bacterium]|nr:HDIG domain-containing protein [Clostridia bacterium]
MKDKISKRRLLISAAIFSLFYALTLILVFVMIIINQPHGWTGYFKNSYTDAVLVCVCLFLLYAIIYYYYYFESKEFLSQPKNVILILSTIVLSLVVNYAFGRIVGEVYIRPAAMLALIFVFLLNRRQAIVLNFVFAFLIFVIDKNTNMMEALHTNHQPYFSLMLTFVSGTVSVFIAGANKTRGGLMLTGVISAIPTVIVTLLFAIPEVSESGWVRYVTVAGYSVAGSLLSAMLALSLLPAFERIFNVLTVFRLSEITSANAPILKRLKTEAPGTFNHSLIVAHLSEMCAVSIGENAELARAAGYYHDVGKLKQPECFTENQTDYNVHDELTPELSADIIRSHATDGYDFLMAAHLPEEIANVAIEHHGTLPIKYFYNKAYKLAGEELDTKDYSYLGPTPRTKISAIVMIADASEAAVRSLSDRSAENVERIVRGIIEERMDLDQFDECDITLKDLATIKETLVAALSGVHHHRVKYPSIRFNRVKEAVVAEQEDASK